MNTPLKKTKLATERTNLFSLNRTFKKSLILLVLAANIFLGFQSEVMAQQSKIDSLLKVLKNTKVDTNLVNTLYKLSYAISDTTPNKAIKYAKQGLDFSLKIKFESGISKYNELLSISYFTIGKYDSAKYFMEIRLKTIKMLKNEKEIANTHYQMSLICSHLGELDLSIDYLNKARETYNKINDKKGIARVNLQTGVIYKNQGQYDKSLDSFLKALDSFQTLMDKQNIAETCTQISQLYYTLKQNKKSEQFALEGLALYKEINNHAGIEKSLYVLSRIYRKQNDFKKSIKCLSEAKTLAEKDNNLYLLTNINTGLALNYREINQLDISLNYFNNALVTAEITKDIDSKASIFEGISAILCDKRDYKNALGYMQKSEQIFKSYKDIYRLKTTYKNYVIVFTELNQRDSVAKYFDKFEQLSDSLYAQQSTKAIAEMQTKYETEKKDKEILTLNMEVTKRKNTVWLISSGFGILLILSGSGFVVFRNQKKKEQAELQKQVFEHTIKALRAQMNPHFIFNCIHSIDSLLDGQRIQESKENLAKFSSLTRSVLENSERGEIRLSEELRILGLYIDLENSRFAVPFNYSFNIDHEIDNELTLIPPLILQPFVENSIKHGLDKNKGGQLKINVQKYDGSLVCLIEDNGCGRNADMKNKSLSAFKTESMGLRLSEDRLKLISQRKRTNARYEIEDLTDSNNNPAGTRVKVTLPFEQLI